MSKNIVWLFLLLLVFPVRAEEVARIIARVNDRAITSSDLDTYCQVLSYRLAGNQDIIPDRTGGFREESLKRLVEDTLILEQAKKEDIEIPRAVVDDKLRQMIAAYPTREEFERSLIEKGLNITLLKEKITEQYLMRQIINRYVKAFVNISPHEISSYYLDHRDEFYSPPGYVFYIAKAEARQLLENISRSVEKEGFDKAEQLYGDDLMKLKSTADKLKAELSEILESLKKGECAVEEINAEFYLVCLEEKIDSRMLTLEESQEAIHAYLWEQKFRTRFTEWVGELKKKAVIRNYYE